MRCFFALLLSEEVKAQVVHLLGRLRPSTPGVKWVRPEQLHITLRFFLSLDATEQAAVLHTGEALCGTASPFSLAVRGVKSFGPRGGGISTLWAGIEDLSGGLARFHASLVETLERAGYAPEPRPFSPHLTLGRLREPSWDPALHAKMEREATFEGGLFSVDSLHLLASELRPSGPVYTSVERWAFGARAL